MSEDRLFERPTLQARDLADAVGLGEDAVAEAIRRGLGANYFDFINGARIAEARRLLRETGLSVADVQNAVGFNSKSSFYVEFNKRVGRTPGAFRRDSALEDVRLSESRTTGNQGGA